ncbi:MAG: HAD-IC family P-type ATPase [Oscillospiraceae bacterium]|nr:HAD-IC family P-type ATPase [Oscillospiraceae bacterium]
MAPSKTAVKGTIIKALPRIQTSPEEGLTSAQAQQRLKYGYANENISPPTKTVGQIFKTNICTYFNLLFFIFAIFIVAVGAYTSLTFLPVIFANTFIGIVQELRSKRVLDKMSILTSPKATVIRDGKTVSVPTDETVLDDVALFSGGDQIYADAIVLSGQCRVNESLVTGESDEIVKNPGDSLTSGSFIVSGECLARLDKVGRECFVSRLTLEAKKGKFAGRGEMMDSLQKIVKVIGIIIIPLGIALFLQQHLLLDQSIRDSVVSTVAALIGMIPEGLFLLASVALTVSIMRLAQKKTLVHDMGCIESLARVDVLCVDKTGTITESAMEAKDIVPLDPDRFALEDIESVMTDYCAAVGGENDTMTALCGRFMGQVREEPIAILPFTSANKYSAVEFQSGAFVLGAPEMILKERFEKLRGAVEEHSAKGRRVLLLAMYGGDILEPVKSGAVFPVALITLINTIRPEAPNTFGFFRQQGVNIKVISGDNPLTVSTVAAEAGIENAEAYVDARTLNTDQKIKHAVEKYTVFGRVTPSQKRKLIRAIKRQGHTVAMTGDGVNDVLALKAADCSVAMASGSDVACQVSQLVLLDSNFASMPSVVLEGRRVINNIERSASLFIVKNVFSLLLAITTLIISVPYPITPAQLSLVTALTIGVPSFVLALAPDKELVHGRFIKNVLRRALPAGITDYLAVLISLLIAQRLGFDSGITATTTTIIMAAVGFMMLFTACRPFTTVNRALFIAMVAGFVLSLIFLSGFFGLTALPGKAVLMLAVIIAACVPVMYVLTKLVQRLLGGR